MLAKSVKIAAMATVLLAFVMGGWGRAAEYEDLSANDLEAKMDSGETILVINPLSHIEFGEGQIRGSVNIPVHTIETTDRLPVDRSTSVVTYCLGPK